MLRRLPTNRSQRTHMRGIAGCTFQKRPTDVTIFHTIQFSVFRMFGVCMTERHIDSENGKDERRAE